MYYLIIEADTNDADYVTSINEVDELELIELQPVFDAIKAFKPYTGKGQYNWPMHDYIDDYTVKDIYDGILTEEQIELFSNYCPRGEYGIHTIHQVTVLTVTDVQQVI